MTQFSPWPLRDPKIHGPYAVVYVSKYEPMIWLVQDDTDLMNAYREIVGIFKDWYFLDEKEIEELDAAVFQESDPKYLASVYGKLIWLHSGREYEVYITQFENQWRAT